MVCSKNGAIIAIGPEGSIGKGVPDMKKKVALVWMVLLLCTLALTGCSSSREETDAASALHVSMINTYVPVEAPQALEDELKAALPQVFTAENELVVNSVSSGDTEKDPMGAMAGMTQIAGMMSSGEMELWLCDSENARRHGDNASLYVPLDELFTVEEQKELGIVPVTLPLMDEQGNLTGEQSAPCGVDLSGCTLITQKMYTQDVAAYVLIDSPHLEQAKEVIRYLVTAE